VQGFQGQREHQIDEIDLVLPLTLKTLYLPQEKRAGAEISREMGNECDL
jgi:hypothetical protein